MLDTKTALIFTFAHMPEKLIFLANPPKDITKDKYNDVKYLLRVAEMVNELKSKDFETRKDSVLPYSKEIILKHIYNRTYELENNGSDSP
jgi:hypothetical protein